MGLNVGDYVIVLDPKTLDTFEYWSSGDDFYDKTVKNVFSSGMMFTIGKVFKITSLYVGGDSEGFYLDTLDCIFYPNWVRKATPLECYLLTGETLCNNS